MALINLIFIGTDDKLDSNVAHNLLDEFRFGILVGGTKLERGKEIEVGAL